VLRLAGGRRWSRAALFPLAFVLLAVPMGFLEDLGFYLRLGVSKTAESVARATGIEIVRNGTQLFSPDGKFQYDVAAACSGVRSLVALFALACLIGYLNVRRWWQRAFVALLTFPFAFLANAARILAIVWAGEKWGHTAGARLHDASGVLVFLIVLGLLLLCVRWMSGRVTPPASGPATRATETGASVRVAQRTAVVCLAAAAVGIGLSMAVIRQIDRRPAVANAGVALAENGRDPAPLPEDVGADWFPQRVEVTAVEREILPPDTGYSRKNYLSLSDRAHQVFVSIVLSGKDRTSIHRPELCIIGQGWTVSERTTYTFDLGGEPLPVTLLRVEREMPGRNGELVKVRTFLAYWFAHPGGVVASHRAMLFRNAFDRVRHLRADRWAYVVAQSVIVGDEAAALEHMRAVLKEVWPKVRRTGSAGDGP
jgi:EpsI family protein